MTGKIRVSIVATALDGHKTENKTVLNMVSRIQNRNSGYSENLFSRNPVVENNTFGSIDGATALKLDESYQLKEEEINNSINSFENNLENEYLVDKSIDTDQKSNNIPQGVSIESASYMENNNLQEDEFNQNHNQSNEEESPKLFSDEQNFQSEEPSYETDNLGNEESDRLFDQEINEEDDFEIPAFLRKQKF